MYGLADVQQRSAAEEAWILGAMAGNRLARRSQDARRRHSAARVEEQSTRAHVSQFGRSVWAAVDESDLADLLDAHANDEEVAAQARNVEARLFAGAFTELPDSMSFVRLLGSKAPSVVPHIFEALRIATVSSQIFREHPPAAPARADMDLVEAPLQMLRWMLAHHRSTVCLAALVYLALQSGSHRPAPWLAERIARTWVEGERAVLSLLVAHHGDKGVPADLAAGMRPSSLPDLEAEQLSAEKTFQEYISAAAAHH